MQSHLQRRKERPNSLIRHLKGCNPGRYGVKREQIDRVYEILENRRLRNVSVGHSSVKKQEQLNYLDPSLLNFNDTNSQATLFSGAQKLKQHELLSYKSGESPNGPRLSPQPRDIVTEPATKKNLIKQLPKRKAHRKGARETEALMNELFLLKTQLNLFKDDNLCLRTQNATKHEKLKDKQKLIDELVAVTKD